MPFINGVTWTPQKDGETNQHVANINGNVVIVFSDTTGQTWEYDIDGDLSGLHAETLKEALREATKEARML